MAKVKKYGGIVVLDGDGDPKTYPKGMPMFVLLGQDEFAPGAIDAYAASLEVNGLADLAEAARAFAMNVRAWQLENPSLVHRPD